MGNDSSAVAVDLSPGPALDALVAERVMGWRVPADLAHALELAYPPGCSYALPIPHYSTSIAAASEMEDEIANRDLGRQYLEALAETIGISHLSNPYTLCWQLVRATPHQRCLAALKAVGYDSSPAPALREAGP